MAIDIPGLLSGLLAAGGSVYAANRAADTANQTGQAALAQSQFRPVGVTTRFGRSGFQFGPDGRLTGAGYEVAPDVAAMREALLGISGGALQQAQQQQGMQGMFRQQAGTLQGLAGSFLPQSYSFAPSAEAQKVSSMLGSQAAMAVPTSFAAQASPEAQALYSQLSGTASQLMPQSLDTQSAAQNYIQRQQALLAPQREQQLAGVRNNLFQRGRSGLATGATSTGMQATNPEMAAYYNALAQQDAQLAANAEQVARQNLQQDIGLSSQLGTTALGQLQQSQQQALQNALARGQFASQQSLAGLNTQQQAEELSRRRLLEGLQVGTGLFGQAANLLGQGYNLQQQSLAPFGSAFQQTAALEQQAQQPLTISAGLGAGSQGAAGVLAQQQNMANQLTLNRNTAVAGALGDPISQLLGKLFSGSGISPANPHFPIGG